MGLIMFIVFMVACSVMEPAYKEILKPKGSILKAILMAIPALIIGAFPGYYVFFVVWQGG